jgi:hypothetical protein
MVTEEKAKGWDSNGNTMHKVRQVEVEAPKIQSRQQELQEPAGGNFELNHGWKWK